MGRSSAFVHRIPFVSGLVLFFLPAYAAADVLGPPMPVYINPARVNEIATDGSLRIDYPSWISSDGLQLLFNSNRKGGHTEMFLVNRPNTASPFGTPTQAPFVNVNGGSGDTRSGIISSNGLELFYYNAGSTPRAIFRATRADVSLPFSNPLAQTSLVVNPTGVHEPQRISQDGLRLYWYDTSGIGFPSTGQYVSTRPNLTSPFGAPSNAPFANLGYAESLYLTPDELQILYINDSTLKWSWRPDLSTPFVPGTALTSLTYGWSQVMWGNELYFANNDDVWRATLVPEPSTLIIALCASLLLLGPRRRRSV